MSTDGHVAPSGPVVTATDVTRRYGQGETAVDALRGVSLQVNPGELVAVMGPSGSGKSTLMHILAALDVPTSGHVTIAGQDIGTLSDREVTLLRREHIGFVFQFFNLLPMLTAEENVVLPLSIAGVKPEKAFLEDLLKRLGIADRRSHRPSELSGGQQQRVAIARALVSRPSVVLADEPTGNLDSATSHEILELLRSATEDYGQTTVMVTHDAAAAAIAGRILFLSDGLIADERARSEPAEILDVINHLSTVIRVSLKGLAGRKLRALLTAFAIILGVAMVSGTYVLTDTIKKGFDSIFTVSFQNADAVVSGKTLFGSSNNTTAPSVPESLLGQIKGLSGVQDAVGGVEYDQTHLVGRDGKAISTGGAPNLGFSVNPRDELFNPLTLVSGRWPTASNEVAIDAGTANSKHYVIGEQIGVSVHGPTRPFKIVGIAELGGVASIGGATLAIFDLPTAQALFHKEGQLDEIRVSKTAAMSTPKLLAEIRTILPSTAQVKTGEQQAKQEASDTTAFLSILQKFLLAFGFVALFVGGFVIVNTLSITIAQRTRELATLRTIGATRNQVLGSVLLESLVIGVLASVVGLFLGVLLAQGLNALFSAAGIKLPTSGIVFAPRTVVVSLGIGIGVTMLASLWPAFRSTRVPPIAAVREGSILPASRFAGYAPLAAVVVIAIGFFGILGGSLGFVFSGGLRLVALGVGVLFVFVGVAIVAPRVVKPITRVVDPVATWSVVVLSVLVYPLTLLFWLIARPFRKRPAFPRVMRDRTANSLAERNVQRNPSRTALAAAALMIGLALVTFVAVLAAGLKSTFESAVTKQFNADYALTSQNGFTPTDIASVVAVRKIPQVTTAAGVRAGRGKEFGEQFDVTAVDPGISKVLKLSWKDGSQATLETLGDTGAVVSESFAKKHDLVVGTPLHVLTPYAKVLNLKVDGIFKVPAGGSPFGSVTTSAAKFDANYPNPQNVFTLINIKGGVTPENTALLNATLKDFPDAKIQTEQEFEKSQEQGIDILLNLLFVLLGLSVVISIFGIVNTLVLTVFERTRELGMLRAVGMTRIQVRRMIRHESVVTSLIGAALGLPLGIVLAVLIGQAIGFSAFSLPVGQLIAFVIAAVIAGIVAAIFPARRASRLNVLAALQYE